MEDTNQNLPTREDPFDKIKKEKDLALKQAREDAVRREKMIMAKRRVHFFVSSLILTIVLTVAIALYPNGITATFCGILVCIFFCIGVSYQKTINTALLIALAVAAVVGTFYFLLNS